MEFDIQGSLLFQPRDEPEESISITDSLLFSQSEIPGSSSSLHFTESQKEQPHIEKPEKSRPEGSKTARLLNGKEVYLKKRSPKPVNVDYSDTILDMDKLHEQVERRRTIREATDEVRRSRIGEKSENPKEQLLNRVWTEKYRPSTFIDLCPAGNERNYRTIMHWLRTKDKAKKVLLIHGPPGVGKTAAAHALANHAGYGVYEVNAANALDSDRTESSGGAFSRQISKLRLRMKNALTLNDVTCLDRPTCLVIDEVDCAANANDIVRVISELVNSKKKPVLRPIICIANDAFTGKAMEKLRSLCELVGFRRPVATAKSGPGRTQRVNVSAQKAVKEYLMEISNKEGLGMDRKEIAEVFEVCEGDMRACINQMQFSGRKLDKALFVGANPAINALKDKNITWFALVDRLFARDQRLSKDEDALNIYDLLLSGEGASSASLDKVVRGCFNRYLEATHFQDDSLMRPAEISDWLHYYDIFHSRPGGDPIGYSTVAPLKFWSLFSEIDPPRNQENVIVPNAKSLDFETLERTKQNKAIVQSISEHVPISLKLSCSTNAEFFACQFLPMLDQMLSPAVGSSRVKLTLRIGEQRVIEKAALIVKQLDLRLETLKNIETGNVSLAFGPNWDTITVYETDSAPTPLSQKCKVLNTKRSWLFPLLQAELELRMAAKVKRVAQRAAPKEVKPKRQRVCVSAPDFYTPKYVSANGEKSESVDPASNAEDENGEDDDHEAKKTTRIWVKYNEGFSNAVRKNIGWVDLWA